MPSSLMKMMLRGQRKKSQRMKDVNRTWKTGKAVPSYLDLFLLMEKL